MRTNIDIDDNLMKQAMDCSQLPTKTKRAVVEEALQLLVRTRARKDVWQLFGAVPGWDDGRQGLAEKDKWAEGDERHREYLASQKRAASAKRKKAA